MRAQGVEYLPDDFVVFVFVQCVFGFHACRDNDGQDNVALLFAFGTAHDAADRLYDIDLGIARGEEQYGIECGHVHAFGQTAHI